MLALFVLLFFLVLGIVLASVLGGNLNHNFKDAQGNVCGITEAYKDYPYLYFTAENQVGGQPTAALTEAQLEGSGVCVKSCVAKKGTSAPVAQSVGDTIATPTFTLSPVVDCKVNSKVTGC